MRQRYPMFSRMMSSFVVGMGMFLAIALINPSPAQAAVTQAGPQLARIDARDLHISLGDRQGQLMFYPNHLDLVVGQTYRLILDNPSPEKHYFSAPNFAAVSWTRKVEAAGVEVKGTVRELELKPNAKAEWVLVPEKPGQYDLECTIAGHAEAGMTGRLTIHPRSIDSV
ncbi:copper-binding protein [Phormidium yuhuli AB48]|uniref:Copper-binding protein n=1 Tax=Phormidium yuhuli AB48 TaxID=2940671 RepID=A0ABY5AXW9_9CYAN|nr:copper-binding protein [Phormidium yuhuli]USR93084.1 copper-binding protein [Phormidium yuhuli AB48]